MEVGYLIKKLNRFPVKAVRKTEKTELLCRALSSQVKAGNLKLVAGDWNKVFVNELVNFPKGRRMTKSSRRSGHTTN
jgi:phage terminase large subunit-like protein